MKKKLKYPVSITFVVTKEMDEALNVEMEVTDRSKAQIIRMGINAYFKEYQKD